GLDILLDRKDALRMAAILAQAGFKRVVAASLPPDSGGEHHYLALEEDSGRIVHLHLRYQLAIGDERLSEYRVPWEPLVLSTRRLDRQAGMRSEEHTSELQSRVDLVCRLLLEKINPNVAQVAEHPLQDSAHSKRVHSAPIHVTR